MHADIHKLTLAFLRFLRPSRRAITMISTWRNFTADRTRQRIEVAVYWRGRVPCNGARTGKKKKRKKGRRNEFSCCTRAGSKLASWTIAHLPADQCIIRTGLLAYTNGSRIYKLRCNGHAYRVGTKLSSSKPTFLENFVSLFAPFETKAETSKSSANFFFYSIFLFEEFIESYNEDSPCSSSRVA